MIVVWYLQLLTAYYLNFSMRYGFVSLRSLKRQKGKTKQKCGLSHLNSTAYPTFPELHLRVPLTIGNLEQLRIWVRTYGTSKFPVLGTSFQRQHKSQITGLGSSSVLVFELHEKGNLSRIKGALFCFLELSRQFISVFLQHKKSKRKKGNAF